MGMIKPGVIKAKAVYCPKGKDHRNKNKILLLLDGDKLYINCKDHWWIQVEFSKCGENINFNDVAVTTSSLPRNIHFDLQEVPVLAIGEFLNREEHKCQQHS